MDSSKYECVQIDAQFAFQVGRLFEHERSCYKKLFHPFELTSERFHDVVKSSKRDKYFAIKHIENIAAIFMFRGLDEGFAIPAFGMYVFEAYSGKGMGSRVIEQAMNYAKQFEYEAIILSVYIENYAALHLYKKYGFIIVEQNVKGLHGPVVRMKLPLTEQMN